MNVNFTPMRLTALVSFLVKGPVLFLVCLLLSSAAFPNTYYVKTSGNDAGAGNSWPTAFQTLQKALAVSTSGDQIWIAKGTYFPNEGEGKTNDDRFVTFSLKDGVALYGGFAGTESLLSQRNWPMNLTVLSGDLQQNDGPNFTGYADNSIHVVQAFQLGAMVTLDGITVQGTNGDSGLFNYQSSLSVVNCTFTMNNGGGVTNFSYPGAVITPLFTNCRFVTNAGRGMFNSYSNTTLTDCTFSGNTASEQGGGMFNYGSTVSLTNCTFSNNTAPTGGGVFNEANSQATFLNSTFWRNGSFAIANNISNTSLVNCTFSENTGGAIFMARTCRTEITNSILWGDGGSEVDYTPARPQNSHGSTLNVQYSIMQGGVNGSVAGPQVLNQDPLFVDIASGNLHLQGCSPAINAGDNGANGTATDLEGHPRKAGTIDLGAYENQGSIVSSHTYYRDADEDGYGDPNQSVITCSTSPPAGYTSDNTDCSDNDANEHPGQQWLVDLDGDGVPGGIVTQCLKPANGAPYTGTLSLIDCNDNDPSIFEPIDYFQDKDGDGFGDLEAHTRICVSTPPPGYSTDPGDCDDNDKAIYPGAPEIADGKDNDCNGQVDDNVVTAAWYRDFDNDGFGDPNRSVVSSTQPAGYVNNNLDCNDYRVFYQDNDHDGWGSSVKVPCGNITRTGDCDDNNNRVHSLQTFYRDADGDSWGNPAVSIQVCSSVPPAGYVANRMDCNDHDKTVRYCPPTTMARIGRDALEEQAATFTLAASPNPFVQTTRIQYSVPLDAHVSLKVYDLVGREVDEVFNGQRSAGTYVQEYHTQKLTPGVYYVRMAANTGGKTIVTQSQKLMKTE